MKQYTRFSGIAITLISCFLGIDRVWAQSTITADGTVSTTVQTSRDRLNFTIQDGTRYGGNLFHSFKEFSIPAGGSAFFDNSPDIVNIIGRVTGGSISNIEGLLRANGTANLFLLNPNGMIFGSNARLDIGGSFLASTASGIKFADGTEFSTAAKNTPPLLTINVPIGLQYNGNAGAIDVNRATLTVQPGRTLALAGGNITINGATLTALTNESTAREGRVNLLGVQGQGTVGLTNNRFSLSPEIQLANISLTNGTTVSSSGSGGGDIQIAARQIKLVDSRVEANTLGSQAGGNLNVFASESVEIVGNNTVGSFANGLFAENQGSGTASNLTIATKDLLVRGDARISTAAFGSASGGNLTVNAGGSVQLIGIEPPQDETFGTLFTGLLTDAHDRASGGKLEINTARLMVRDGAQVSAATYGSGNGGNLTVKAAEQVELVGGIPSDLFSSGLFTAVQPEATGKAGNLIVETRNLIVRDGAQIFAGTGGAGNGGNLTVTATEKIELTGISPIYAASSGLFSGANLGVAGSAGDLTLNTPTLIVKDGAQVSAATGGTGKVGTLTVNANSVQLIGVSPPVFTDLAAPTSPIYFPSGLFSNVIDSSNHENAGSVRVNAERLIIQGGARVAVRNSGKGNGGDINIQTGFITIDSAGNPDPAFPGGIIATTLSGEGGNINLQARDLLTMRRGSAISTNATVEDNTGGTGNGGNIRIDTDILTSLENSDITAKAIEGRGGNINIATQGIFISPDSEINASSQLGIDGQVNVKTPDIDPSKGLVIFPTQIVNIEGLVARGCSGSRGQNSSKFNVTGRGGLPDRPDEIIDRETVLADWGTPAVADRISASVRSSTDTKGDRNFDSTQFPIVEAQGWVIASNGEVVLTAKSDEVTPSSPWQNIASCNAP